MTAPFTIKKGVPLPGKALVIYPLAELEVGDCFDAPRDMGKNTQGADKRQNSITKCVSVYRKRHNPSAKFTVRLIDENTVRCWRIA